MTEKSPSGIFKVLHRIFEVGIILKGINAAIEFVAGISLLLIPTLTIKVWILKLVKPLRDHNPNSIMAAWGDHFVGRMSSVAQDFVAWYFLSHGIIKGLVVICLLRGWMWAYPVSLVIFAGFMGFQTWEFIAGSHSLFYIFLDVFDAILIALAINEWRHAKANSVPDTSKVSS